MKKFLLLLFISMSFPFQIFGGLPANAIVKTDYVLKWPNVKKVRDLKAGGSVLALQKLSSNNTRIDNTCVNNTTGSNNYGIAVPKPSKIVEIIKKTTDTMVFIVTSNGNYYSGGNQMFYDPVRSVWIKAKDLTKKDTLLSGRLQYVDIQDVKVEKLKEDLSVYDIKTDSPHVFFLCSSKNNSVLVHNFPMTLYALGQLFLCMSAPASPPLIPILTTVAAPVIGAVMLYKHVTKDKSPQMEVDVGDIDVSDTGRILTKLVEFRPAEFRKAAQIEAAKIAIRNNDTLVRNNEIKRVNDVLKKDRPRRGGPGPEEEREKLKAEGYAGREKNSRQLRKAHISQSKNLEEHQDKLKKYIQNPDKYDNNNLLKHASPEERANIIKTRVSHLENEIKNFLSDCNIIQEGLKILGIL